MRAAGILLAICLASVASTACSSRAPLFTMTEPPSHPRGKTIAVVSGLKKDINVFIAGCMADALQRRSTFQVIPHDQVARKLPSYPFNIAGPYRSAYFDIEEDYSRTDLAKVRELHRMLGADYLFIIWAPTGSTLEKKIVFVDMISQLFEGPGAREVGHGVFWASAGRSTCFLSPTPKEEDVQASLKKACDRVATEIAEKTGMEKKQQNQ
jgi:hypothetical protein